jgi:hypothetical protein
MTERAMATLDIDVCLLIIGGTGPALGARYL